MNMRKESGPKKKLGKILTSCKEFIRRNNNLTNWKIKQGSMIWMVFFLLFLVAVRNEFLKKEDSIKGLQMIMEQQFRTLMNELQIEGGKRKEQ